MSLSTLEVLYAAKVRLENPRTKWDFMDMTACTCGHIYAAANGHKGRSSREVFRGFDNRYRDVILTAAHALGYVGYGADGAAWYVSDRTSETREAIDRPQGSPVPRAAALRIINGAIERIEAQQEQDRLDVLAQAREIVDNAPLPVAA